MPNRAERTVFVATCTVLFATSVVLNAIAFFLVPLYVDGVLGIGAAIALVGNLVLGLLGGWGTRRVTGVVWGFAGWLVDYAAVTLVRRGDDVVLAGSLSADHNVVTVSTLCIFAGLVAYVVSIAAGMLLFARPVAAPAEAEPGLSGAGTTPSG